MVGYLAVFTRIRGYSKIYYNQGLKIPNSIKFAPNSTKVIRIWTSDPQIQLSEQLGKLSLSIQSNFLC